MCQLYFVLSTIIIVLFIKILFLCVILKLKLSNECFHARNPRVTLIEILTEGQV